MARAPNPGAPQRVSAHVVPKAASFSTDDEDEKTTIESGGWEEEASTTVEQGEVADKVRALGLGAAQSSRSNTGITSTNGAGVNDEPTVDDQRASAALALLPPSSVARLVVTQGSDSGQVLEVRPGKTYSVGRGIDNDLVLTDITASRRHFDIRNENGSWILADQRSGNGTLINNRMEDEPFLLATGDRIEVGNTLFRFELVAASIALPGLPRELPVSSREAPMSLRGAPGELGDDGDMSDSRELVTPEVAAAPPVPRASAAHAVVAAGHADVAGAMPTEAPTVLPTYDGSVDDDLELSTMSGQPLRDADAAQTEVAASRPKTLPPPAPLPRPRTQSGRPAMAFAAQRSQQLTVPQVPGLPPGALAAAIAPPISPLHAAPPLPQPSTTLPLPQMATRGPLAPTLLDPQIAPLPATLPGQGPPPPIGRGPRLPFSYPGAPELAPPRISASMRAQLQVAPGMPGRDATSTALVQPMSYSGNQPVMMAPQPHRMVPSLPRRVKLAFAAVGLVVFAAIATVAIIRSATDDGTSGSSSGSAAAPAIASSENTSAAVAVKPPAVTAPMVTPLPANDKVVTPAASMSKSPASTVAPPAPSPPPPAPSAATTAPSVAATAPSATTTGGSTPSTSAPRTTPSTAAPTTPTPSSTPAPAPAPAPSSSTGGGSTAASSTRPSAAVRPIEASNDRRAPEPAIERPARSEPTATRTSKPARHVEVRKPERRPVEVAAAPPKPERKHTGRSMQDLKAEATGLYRSKNFSAAAQAINSSLAGFGPDDTKDLKTLAGIYSQLGKAYAVGMAPGTRAIEALPALQRALSYDREVGGAYGAEIRERIGVVAPKAAGSFMAAKSFEQALQAVRVAESVGSTSESLKSVRSSLDGIAHDLLSDARRELSSDPDGARQKLRQVLVIVEPKSPLYAQAQKLLNGQ